MIARERLPLAGETLWRKAWDRCGKPAAGLAGRAVGRVLPTPGQGSVGILMYHRIAPRVPGAAEPTWNVTPRQFRRQLAGLLSAGYQPLALRTVLAAMQAGEPLAARGFVITFDDGYENLYQHAWPVLKDLQAPATIFVPTAYLDSSEPMPFETWTAAGTQRVPPESWRCLSTPQCRELMDGGLVEIGSHTHTHDDFRSRPEALREDVQTSLEVLRKRLGLNDATFAFPFGRKQLGFSGGAMQEAARQAGVLCCLTTESELVQPGSNPFDWGRFTVTQSDTPATLQMKLDGWYAVARSGWRQFRRLWRAGN